MAEQVTPEPILQIGLGFMASKQLLAGADVGVFEQLSEGPATIEELAQRTGTPLRPTRVVADALVALGFLEKEDGVYRNAPVSATFLSGATPADMRALMPLIGAEYRQWTHYEEVVRTGQPLSASVADDVETYAGGMEALSGGTAQALAATYDFGRHRRLLDLGGSTGVFTATALAAYPTLEGTLFELPQTAALARERLKERPESARIEVVDGDFFTDPLPEGHDVILLSNIVHNFPPEQVPLLLRRVREAAPDGGRVLVVDAWTNADRTEPVMATLLSGQLFLETAGEVYSADDGRRWLEETGWRVLDHAEVVGPFTMLVGEAAPV